MKETETKEIVRRKEVRRDKKITVRFTEKEYERELKRAAKQNKKLPAYIRESLSKRNPDKHLLEFDERKKLLREIASQGNNINQLTRAINTGNYSEQMSQQVEELSNEFTRIRALLREMIK